MPDQRIESLNDAEQQWIARELVNARQLVDLLSPSDAGAALVPEVLDRAYKAAREAAGQSAEAANSVINAVGMAFGQYLVDQLWFKWVVVFDKDGSEIAVVALPGEANVLVFPPNLVGKRWVEGTTDFLGYVYKGIEEDLRKFEAGGAGRPSNEQATGRKGTAGKTSWFGKWFGRGRGRWTLIGYLIEVLSMPKVQNGSRRISRLGSPTADQLAEAADQLEAWTSDPGNTDDPKWLGRRVGRLRQGAAKKKRASVEKQRQRRLRKRG
jgi:hypothetical protein